MNICVYGAASQKVDEKYIKAVEELGYLLAERGHTLVFGAGATGVMGAAARGVKRCDGKIIGVIPTFFLEECIEAVYLDCDEIIYTKTMHERKLTMEENADAFIVAPGGIGTLEEFFETLTLRQLKRHTKPIAILNVDGFYDTLTDFISECTRKKFIESNCSLLYSVFSDTTELFNYIESQKDYSDLTVRDFKDGGL